MRSSFRNLVVENVARWKGHRRKHLDQKVVNNCLPLLAAAATVTGCAILLVDDMDQQERRAHPQGEDFRRRLRISPGANDDGMTTLGGSENRFCCDNQRSFMDTLSLSFKNSTRLIFGSSRVLFTPPSTTSCQDWLESLHEFDQEHPDGYTEAERFYQCLEYHRALLFDYSRRWKDDELAGATGSEIQWPRNIPKENAIPSLEMDWEFCKASPEYLDNRRNCQNMQFRIASYYLLRCVDDPEKQRKGYKLVKDLADQGHPDGMCLYAIILMDGRVPGVDAKPEEAVVWFRRCVELHRHITATYELGVAFYTGDGGVVNPDHAVRMFRQGAHFGHAGAAYMLGECMLDGVGCKRDRANALEWLVTAAELGHRKAQTRVLGILLQDHDELESTSSREARIEESMKWMSQKDYERISRLERRHTIGAGGPLSPKLVAKRKSKVQESREG